jgi:hypothetical protein
MRFKDKSEKLQWLKSCGQKILQLEHDRRKKGGQEPLLPLDYGLLRRPALGTNLKVQHMLGLLNLVALIRQAWNQLPADLREWWVFGNDVKRDFAVNIPVLQK